MGYVIVSRNPNNKRLIAIVDGADPESLDDRIAEFETEQEAIDAADNTTICKAWGYQVVEIT